MRVCSDPARNAQNSPYLYPTCDAKGNKIPLRFMRVNLMFMYHVCVCRAGAHECTHFLCLFALLQSIYKIVQAHFTVSV